MRINRLSLLNSLFSVINENNQGDSYFVLAHYFLEHYRGLDTLNIYDVADECFVSRASVRRFCQSIGYDNFKDLKSDTYSFDEEFKDDVNHFYRPDYREHLTESIQSMLEELNRRMDNEGVDRFVERMHNSRNIVFITSNTTTARIRDFQQAMIICNKVVRLVSEMYTDNELLESLDERDCLITVSSSGRLAYAAKDIVKNSKAYKFLITVNRDQSFLENYDRVFHLSANDLSMEKSVYGKYGIDYMFDVVYSTYIQKYDSEIQRLKGERECFPFENKEK